MNHILSLIEDLQKESSKKSRNNLEEEVEEEDIEEEDVEKEDIDAEEGAKEEAEGTEGEGNRKEESSQFRFTLPARLYLELSEALFQLSMIFWTYRDLARDITSLVLIHFIAVQGIHRHSLAYKSAYNSTSGFSRLI